MGLFTVELREGAWYMWALFKYSKTEWGSDHKIEYPWKWFLLHASISQISKLTFLSSMGRIKKCPYSCLLLYRTSNITQLTQLNTKIFRCRSVLTSQDVFVHKGEHWGVRNLCGFGQLSRSWGISSLLPPVPVKLPLLSIEFQILFSPRQI